jgi:hypothetical protein
MGRSIKEDSWIKNYWRPAMAYQYLVVCLFDFVINPVLTMILAYSTHSQYIPWEPMTLKESGFYHLSMGAIIGVAAWTRGQEKIRNVWTGETTVNDVTTQTPTK